MKNKTVLFVTKAAMIAAVYVVLTIVLAPISFGQVQLRVSEALTIMPVFTAAAIPGVFITSWEAQCFQISSSVA